MKTIKLIDLLNKIANGEEVPKKIKFNNIYCYYRECKNEYVDYTNKPIIQWDYVVMNSLNDEVEILEEEPRDIEVCGSWITKSEYNKLAHSEEEKKIPEKIEYYDDSIAWVIDDVGQLSDVDKVIIDKLNEIIDYLNYLKSKGE